MTQMSSSIATLVASDDEDEIIVTSSFEIFDVIHQAPPSWHQTTHSTTAGSMTASMCASMTASWSSVISEGIQCFSDDRELLSQLGRFCNNRTLSDLRLKLGGKSYRAHRLILAAASPVFETMLCNEEWIERDNKEITLEEVGECEKNFLNFLKFLYSGEILLNADNILPMLLLADKYQVIALQNTCVEFAKSCVINNIELGDVFNVWFTYSTQANHRQLVSACVYAIAQKMDEVLMSTEWDVEWTNLDICQLVSLLGSSDLVVRDEWEVWEGVLRWLQAPNYITERNERDLETNLIIILPNIRFAMMTPERLCEIESGPLYAQMPHLFSRHLHLAYKFLSLSLSIRSKLKDLQGPPFLLRNYKDVRWDKRLFVKNLSTKTGGEEILLRFNTKSCTLPPQTWEWELKVFPRGSGNSIKDCRMILSSNQTIDNPRPLEFQLSLVDSKRMLVLITGIKNFKKNRFTNDLDLEKKVDLGAIITNEESPDIVDDSLVLQVAFRPILG